jgi:aryl-alcohol dehydrogenase-like predicted oxidoreductase
VGFARQGAHLDVCNVTVEQLAVARSVVEIATVQSPFNLADTSRADLLAECEAHGIGFIRYRPLQGGQLAEAGGAVAAAAKRHGATPGRDALAWLLARSPAIPPIPGTASAAHLEENVAPSGLASPLVTSRSSAGPTKRRTLRPLHESEQAPTQEARRLPERTNWGRLMAAR